MARKKKASLDVDGPLLQSREYEFFEFARQVKGITDIEAKIAVYQETHDWEQAFELPKEVVTRWYEEFDESPHCPPPEQVPGALTALRCLQQQGVDFDVVSQRSAKHYPRLRQTFARLFAGVRFDELHLVNGGLKHAAVELTGASVHVEDSLHMARNVAQETSVKVIVFPHPFNWRHPRHDKLIYTEAHSRVMDGMQLIDWIPIWLSAWWEIRELVLELMAR